MHPNAVEHGDATAGHENAPAAVSSAAVLHELREIRCLLRDLLLDSEQEADFDQTYVIGGNPAGATVAPIQIPRTLRHIEVTLNTTTGNEVAVLAGNNSLALVQQQHGHNAGVTGSSSAICTTNGGNVTARDFTDQSGYLTVYFTAASTGYVNLRVRSLDYLQSRGQRT